MNFAGKAVEFVYARRAAFGLFVALFFAFAFWTVSRARFEENIYDILPFEDKVLSSYLYAGEKFSQSNTLYFNVSGGDAQNAVLWLASELRNCKKISKVFPDADAAFSMETIEGVFKILPFLFTEADASEMKLRTSLHSLESEMEALVKNLHSPNSFEKKMFLKLDPLGTFFIFSEKAKSLRGDMNFGGLSEGFIKSKDGKNFMVMAEAGFDSSDSEKSADLMRSIEARVKVFQEKFPLAELSIAGGYRVSAENAAIAKRDSKFCISLTFALVAIICILAFRNKLCAFVALLPSLIGTAAAFCLLIFVEPKISTIAIAFASIAIGVSMDYAVHILYRLDLRGKVSLELAKETASHLAKPILVTSGTSAIAFVIIYFFGASGFKQLGIFGALGIAFSALASLLLLPAFAVGISSKKKNGCDIFGRAGEFFEKVLSRFEKFRSAIIFTVSALCLPFALNVEFDGKISSLSGLSESARLEDAKLKEIWAEAVSGKIIVAKGKDFSEARLENEKLENLLKGEEGVCVANLSKLLPSDERALENAKRWREFWKVNYELVESNLMKASRKNGIKFEALKGALTRLKLDVDFDYFQKNSLLKIFKGRISDDSCAIANFVKIPEGFDKKAFAQRLFEFSENLSYIDTDYLSEHIAQTSFKWMKNFALAALAAVSLYLFFTLGSLKEAMSILTPVCVGMLWSFALMGIFGVKVNIVNAIFVIFSVCIAQDYAVFLRYSDSAKEGRGAAIAVVLISAFTTMSAFGSLSLASHPVMKTLGLSATISIFSILCACLVISRKRKASDG